MLNIESYFITAYNQATSTDHVDLPDESEDNLDEDAKGRGASEGTKEDKRE